MFTFITEFIYCQCRFVWFFILTFFTRDVNGRYAAPAEKNGRRMGNKLFVDSGGAVHLIGAACRVDRVAGGALLPGFFRQPLLQFIKVSGAGD